MTLVRAYLIQCGFVVFAGIAHLIRSYWLGLDPWKFFNDPNARKFVIFFWLVGTVIRYWFQIPALGIASNFYELIMASYFSP